MDSNQTNTVYKSKKDGAINLKFLFRKHHLGNDVEEVLQKISYYINWFDDISYEQERDLSNILSSKFDCVKVNKYKLNKDGKFDVQYMSEVYDELLKLKLKYNTTEVIQIDNIGFYFFIVGMNERTVMSLVKNYICLIDPRFFERMSCKDTSFVSKILFNIERFLNVR